MTFPLFNLPPCPQGRDCVLHGIDGEHDGELHHPPRIHLRDIAFRHPDRAACPGRDALCSEVSESDHVRIGTCVCIPPMRTILDTDAQLREFRKAHPTSTERDEAINAAWIADPPATLDERAWIRARAGLNEALRISNEAWDAVDGDPDDVRARATDGFVVGFIAALAAVRALEYSRTAAVMWAMAEDVRPGSFAAWLIDANTKGPDVV